MPDDEDLKEFLAEHSGAAPSFVKSGGRQSKKSLLQGEVEGTSFPSNPGGLQKVRLMKVVSIERTDTTRIAHIDLRVKDGTLIKLEIDEATAASIHAVFQSLPLKNGILTSNE